MRCRSVCRALVWLLAALGWVIGMSLAPAGAMAIEDSTPPQLLGYSLTPRQVDTSNGDQVVTLTLTLSDDLSGIQTYGVPYVPGLVSAQSDRGWYGLTTSLFLVAPTGTQNVCISGMRQVSGDQFGGVYVGSVVLPRGSAKGKWTVDFLALVDNLNNRQSWSAAELEARFGSGSATVENVATWDDSQAPKATSFSMTPNQVDTSQGDQTVTFRVSLTDEAAGVDQFGVSLYSTSSKQIQTAFMPRVSGDEWNGIYEGTAVLPRGSAKGRWFASLDFSDKFGNRGWHVWESGSGTLGEGAQWLTNHAAFDDTTPPSVASFSITPPQIDTGEADQTVRVTVRLTDDFAGLPDGIVGVQLAPLIGTQVVIGEMRRISGDSMDGVYAADITLPRHSKEGVWTVRHLFLNDRLDNRQWLDSNGLSNVLADSSQITVANTATSDAVTIDREWTISAPRTTVTFPAGTVVTRGGGGSFAFYRMAAHPFSMDGSIGTNGLAGVPIGTVRMGIPGLNLTFSKPVTISMLVGREYEGYTLRVQSLGEDAPAWAREAFCVVRDGRIKFTVNHATYFAATVHSKPTAAMSVLDPRRRGSRVYDLKGYISPKHSVRDTNKVRLKLYKKGKDGVYRWKKSVSASYISTSAGKTRFGAKVKFPSTGRWRVRAYHAADSRNAKSYSKYRYVTVR